MWDFLFVLGNSVKGWLDNDNDNEGTCTVGVVNHNKTEWDPSQACFATCKSKEGILVYMKKKKPNSSWKLYMAEQWTDTYIVNLTALGAWEFHIHFYLRYWNVAISYLEKEMAL